MRKYRITWDAGFGKVSHITEAPCHEAALAEAKELCFDQFESNATWSAKELVSERGSVDAGKSEGVAGT